MESKGPTTLLVEQFSGSSMSHKTRLNLREDSLEEDFKAQSSLAKGKGRGYICNHGKVEDIEEATSKAEANAYHKSSCNKEVSMFTKPNKEKQNMEKI